MEKKVIITINTNKEDKKLEYFANNVIKKFVAENFREKDVVVTMELNHFKNKIGEIKNRT